MSSNVDEMVGGDDVEREPARAVEPPATADADVDGPVVTTDASEATDPLDGPDGAPGRRTRGADESSSMEAAPDSDGAPGAADGAESFAEDGRADKALDFVVDVLTSMGLDCTVDLMENGDDDPPSDIRIEVSGRDSDRLVGKKGQTLAALQFLVNRVVNRPPLPRRHILLDAGGYRARREGALSSMALRLGQQAADEGKIITFEPMSAQDRRVVHLALAKFEGVVTKSEGKGATRRVQIIPVRD